MLSLCSCSISKDYKVKLSEENRKRFSEIQVSLEYDKNPSEGLTYFIGTDGLKVAGGTYPTKVVLAYRSQNPVGYKPMGSPDTWDVNRNNSALKSSMQTIKQVLESSELDNSKLWAMFDNAEPNPTKIKFYKYGEKSQSYTTPRLIIEGYHKILVNDRYQSTTYMYIDAEVINNGKTIYKVNISGLKYKVDGNFSTDNFLNSVKQFWQESLNIILDDLNGNK